MAELSFAEFLKIAHDNYSSEGWFFCFVVILFFLRSLQLRYDYLRFYERADDLSDSDVEAIGKIHTLGQHSVVGRVVCDNPLTVPVTNDKVVWYNYQHTEHFTKRERTLGVSKSSTAIAYTKTLCDETKSVPFFVEDESGRIAIDSDGAQRVGTIFINKYREEKPEEFSFFGSFTEMFRSMKTGYRSKSRFKDYALGLRLGAKVFIKGTVERDKAGNLVFRGKDDGNGSFVVTTGKKEEEVKRIEKILKEKREKSWNWTLLSFILAAFFIFSLWATVKDVVEPRWKAKSTKTSKHRPAKNRK